MGVVIGTSGWQYADWKDVLYATVPQRRWLEHYTRVFPCVEIKDTFYNLPPEKTFASWDTRTPEGFEFVCKASRYITHIRRLVNVEDSIALFMQRAAPLRDKLGPVLYQLPPTMKRDDEKLRSFLQVLPEKPAVALEFRHGSWYADEVYEMLRAKRVALVVADSPKHRTPIETTADWSYIRLHGGEDETSYGADGLAAWAGRVVELAARCDPIYVFFNNDRAGNAVIDALSLTDKVRSAGAAVVSVPAA
jgi:uncharacterized protein YecE (DUF72 family)